MADTGPVVTLDGKRANANFFHGNPPSSSNTGLILQLKRVEKTAL
jgi:hypothetical protein